TSVVAGAVIALSLLAACREAGTIERKQPDENTAGSAGMGSGGGGIVIPGTRETAGVRCETSDVGPPQLRRLTQLEYQNTISDVFPEIAASWQGVRLGPDPTSPLGFTNDASVLVVSAQTAQEILDTAEDVAEAVTAAATLPSLLPCASSTKDAACAGEFIGKYGARLFRRPLSADETQRYGDFHASVAARSSFEIALKWTLVGMLESPSAVYRSELGSGGSLTPQEIASELSYSFSASPPSAELLARAESGAFATAEARVTEARALLGTPRGQELLTRMFREWAGYAKVSSATRPDEVGFENVRASMIAETQRFIDEIVRVQGGGVRELLTAPTTYLDSTLSTFYGYGSGAGTDFTAATRPPDWGVGLLAQGSIITGNAHSEGSSPTLRGLVVFERLFCNAKPLPPPVVDQITPPAPGATTTRERYEMSHASDSFCQSCHVHFDPIGFGFEHFDQVGRYRADESGLPIDATGHVTDAQGVKVLEFDGLTALASGLAELPQVTDCVSGLLAAYVFAGGGGKSCLAEEARAGLASGQPSHVLGQAVLAAAPHFTQRQ
ncbi:MAG TPA: DUF1588 domain-containing protein, partial [Polyangiaceae bacterium]|nr:DUF1588 domain-containing protein [Polyangiaceae bacterium]